MAVSNLRFLVKRGFVTIPNYATYVDARVLGVTSSETVTVPTNGTVIVMKSDVDFFVDFNATTATIPAADITGGTSPVFVPAGVEFTRVVDGVSAFGIISNGAAVVTMEFYS